MERRCTGCGDELMEGQIRCQRCGTSNHIDTPVNVVYSNPHRMYEEAEEHKF